MTGEQPLWQVTADIGRGWPTCTGREHQTRRYTTARAAARWIATIDALPSHHRLVACEYAVAGFEDLTADQLDALRALRPPMACTGCGAVDVPPGPCPACGSRARHIAPTPTTESE